MAERVVTLKKRSKEMEEDNKEEGFEWENEEQARPC